MPPPLFCRPLLPLPLYIERARVAATTGKLTLANLSLTAISLSLLLYIYIFIYTGDDGGSVGVGGGGGGGGGGASSGVRRGEAGARVGVGARARGGAARPPASGRHGVACHRQHVGLPPRLQIQRPRFLHRLLHPTVSSSSLPPPHSSMNTENLISILDYCASWIRSGLGLDREQGSDGLASQWNVCVIGKERYSIWFDLIWWEMWIP